MNTVLSSVLLPGLMILAALVNFLVFNGYFLATPEVLASAIGILLLGMPLGIIILWGSRGLCTSIITCGLIIFLDLVFDVWDWHVWVLLVTVIGVWTIIFSFYRNLISVLTVVFLVIIFSTIVLPGRTPTKNYDSRTSHPQIREVSQLPLVLHIILDGHIGVEGIPEEIQGGNTVKKTIKDFFLGYGFRLFGRAYSHFFNTQDSIPNLVNFSAHDTPTYYFQNFHDGDLLTENKYFSVMAERGYHIRVYQTDYINYCHPHDSAVESCLTVNGTGPGSIQNAKLPLTQKIWIIASQFVELSFIYRTIRETYQETLRPLLGSKDLNVPSWDWERRYVFPLSATQVLQAVGDDALVYGDGTLFFVHVGIPHEPYVYNAQCEINPSVKQWLDRVDSKALHPFTNDKESRIHRFKAYFKQVLCTKILLQGLFDNLKKSGLYEKAKIIVHGDHGARIMMAAPLEENKRILSTRDLVDGYSTLFSIKWPNYDSGYELDQRPIDELFEMTVIGASVLKDGAESDKSFVFLQGKPGTFIKESMGKIGLGKE